jgi:outer membrane receptor protein involved in Fe transport
MKRNFEGIQIDANYGFDQHENGNDDAHTFLNNGVGFGTTGQGVRVGPPLAAPGDVVERNNSQVSIIMGANSPDNKGNVTAYAEYTNLEPILESSRDFSACTITVVNDAHGVTNGKHACAGSSNNAFGRFNLNGQFKLNPDGTPALNSKGNKQGFSWTNFQAPAGSFVPFSPAADYNFGPLNYFQRSDDRYNLGAFGHYEFNEHADVYMDTMFMDDHTIAQIAPSGFFQGPTYFIPCNNAFLSATQQGQLGCGSVFEGGNAMAPAGTPAGSIATTIGYRLLGSNRQDDLRHTDYRIVLGSKGEISEGWNYDAYVQYGASIYAEHYLNDVSITKLQNALNTVSTTQCVVGGACVPINIFSSAQPSKAAVDYVLTPGLKEGQTTEEIAEADVNGDLGQYGLKSPFAKEAVKVALGLDYRREELDETPDNEFQTGDLAGQGAATPPVHGSFNVYEIYGEVSAPLISDVTFVKALNFEGGYRYSHYSDVGETTTYKLALDYAPIDDFKLRGSFNHAVRAPNVDELFAPASTALYAGQDPCSTNTLTGKTVATLAQCELTGVTPAQYGLIPQCPSSQCGQLIGGNPNLKPENADTTTFGVVFTPTFIRNFSATVDFYNIRVDNIIQAVVPNVSVNECLAGVEIFCKFINRDPANGSLLQPSGFVTSTYQNTGYLQTKGYDFEINYRFKLTDIAYGGFQMPDYGSVGINFVGTYVESFITQPLTGGPTYNCAGLYGPTCSDPNPHWRHKIRLTWMSPWNFDLSLQWRYVGGVKLDFQESNPLFANGYVDPADGHLAGVSYLDLSGNWRIKDGFTVRAGINNLADKDPPLVGTVACAAATCNGNTYPGVYDALGRTIFLGLTAKF